MNDKERKTESFRFLSYCKGPLSCLVLMDGLQQGPAHPVARIPLSFFSRARIRHGACFRSPQCPAESEEQEES